MRAIPSLTITTPSVELKLLNDFIVPYVIPTSLLSEEGPQFAGSFFAALFDFLGTDLTTTMDYHPQCNGHTERYNKKIVAGIIHEFKEYQYDWDTFVEPLTYDYNIQVHRSTGTTPHPSSKFTSSQSNYTYQHIVTYVLDKACFVALAQGLHLDRLTVMRTKADKKSATA